MNRTRVDTPRAPLRAFACVLAVCLAAPTCPGITTDEGDSLSGRLEGFVLDSDNRGIAGATVTAARAGTGGTTPASTTTNADGNYNILQLEPTAHTVSATATDFECDGPKNVTVSARSPTHLNFTCTRTDANVTVTVNGPSGPLPGVEVTLGEARQVTGSDGRTVFLRVEFGSHSVRAVRTAFYCPPGSIAVPGPGSYGVTIVCISLASPPAGSIVVTVTLPSPGAEPVAGAFVGITGPSSGGMMTGSDGVAVFLNRQPGSYGISVTRSGFLCTASTVVLPANGFATANSVCTPN